MWIQTLRLDDLRCFHAAELELGPGTNLFVGPNGAGKTSLIEAAFVLSYARSFRRGGRASLVRRGAERLVVHAAIRLQDGRVIRIGLQQGRDGQSEGRLDGRVVPRLSELVTQLAVCCFEPGSHELIGGPSDQRRAFLDWGLFHVEPGFLATWRRAQRAVRQRNALLKAAGSERELRVWDRELAEHGARITARRAAQLDALRPLLARHAARWVPELGALSLEFEPGWGGGGTPSAEGLERELLARRERDRARAHTSAGPHRADWTIGFEHAPRREHLSRGQEKLVALACVLAQAELYRELRGEWPVMCFDDLASELDQAHRQRVVDSLVEAGAQLLITGTDPSSLALPAGALMFHVEQGRVRGPESAPAAAAGPDATGAAPPLV